MRQARTWRLGAWMLLAGWSAMVGCIHNHYYGATPVCGEPMAPTAVVPGGYGAVCDVPTQVNGGSVVAQGPGRTTVVANAPRPSQVLVSEPRDAGPVIRGPGRFSWRRSDPENLATTKVDGAIEDDSVNR